MKSKGISTDGRVFILDRAHVLLELRGSCHRYSKSTIAADGADFRNVDKRVDGLEEAGLGSAKVGTTGSGIGPVYARKARSGIRINKVMDKQAFDYLLRRVAEGVRKRYAKLLDYDLEKEIADFDCLRRRIRPMVVETVPMLVEAQRMEENIFVEGAYALLLDVDYGTYPFVTSSSAASVRTQSVFSNSATELIRLQRAL